jgi:hypothetical protein
MRKRRDRKTRRRGGTDAMHYFLYHPATAIFDLWSNNLKQTNRRKAIMRKSNKRRSSESNNGINLVIFPRMQSFLTEFEALRVIENVTELTSLNLKDVDVLIYDLLQPIDIQPLDTQFIDIGGCTNITNPTILDNQFPCYVVDNTESQKINKIKALSYACGYIFVFKKEQFRNSQTLGQLVKLLVTLCAKKEKNRDKFIKSFESKFVLAILPF